ncbi:hypothetical protein F5Y06DRAFT_288788 [Hypoxylon sp. FL0890]|nr:hypothetical protein F5Y06DRAFT_288788 [Hypoxylon sp. FL0890]
MGRSGYDTTSLRLAEESETPYSICSADTPAIEEDHPLFKLKDLFLHVVMATFMQAQRGRQQDEDVQITDNIEASVEPADHERDANDRPRKRGRLSDSVSTVAGEKQSQRSLTKRRAQDRRLWLACPYAKKDPVRYRDCYRYFLARVRDVKQHLSRCHRRPMYCPTCKETFEDEDEKDRHITSRSCTLRPSVVIEGITESQRRQLSQRVKASMPEEQQWFAVFDTLFSPHPRPRTPYRNREMSDDLCVFQDFMTARGPALLTEFLEARGVITSDLPREEGDLATFMKEVLGEGLQRIIDQWTSDSATAIEPVSASHSLRSSPTVDSGIALQIGYPRTADDRHKTENSSGSDLNNPNLGDERREGDPNQPLFDVFGKEGNPWKGMDTFQADNGSGNGSQSLIDSSEKLSGDVSTDHGQKGAQGLPDSLNISQFPELADYAEAAIFSAPTGVSDLLGNFDPVEWQI